MTALGILDAVGWQTVFDLESGQEREADGPLCSIARKIQQDHPYPGDQEAGAMAWVTDTALGLTRRYSPELVLLNYANPFFLRTFSGLSREAWLGAVATAFVEAGRFIEESGFCPVVLGTGSLTPVMGRVDLSTIDGIENVTGPVPTYAAVDRPSTRDLKEIEEMDGIRWAMTKDEVVRQFRPCKEQAHRLPDLLLAAEQGWIFRGFGSVTRPVHAIPGLDREIPIHSDAGTIRTLPEIKPTVLRRLEEGDKVAFIIIEGVGTDNFLLPWTRCDNTFGEFIYPQGGEQYLAAMTGEHLNRQPHPPAYFHFREDDENKPYPFSGYFTALPERTLGGDWSGKSVAVGSRSTLTHLTTGADIALECYARNLYNFGTLAVVREQKKRGDEQGE
ncbi:hypothetical protein RJ40_09300 [Methanofollis aquaemaris]|uniref:Uncharacterized protein n=1 Tax=Methanofollis aquaemaris TaxID=126734 RepID=A0A8A3S750_9EURY|nr:hypothetical protein [Methanofollis aquaemaris]QSZ67689.1 hypothetical protein RJ40_09300 [Methanofollis aquaemaris]